MVPESFLKLVDDQMDKEGLSLRTVAKRAGVSASFLSRILAGERGLPSNEVLLELGRALNVHPPARLLIEAGRLPTRELGELSETDAKLLARAAQEVIMRQRRRRSKRKKAL